MHSSPKAHSLARRYYNVNGLHARAPTGQIKYDVANAKQFDLDACRVAQNISERLKHIVFSGHQITQALILSFSAPCACFKPHTEASKAELLPRRKIIS